MPAASFILSRQESAVFVFDREGRFLRRFGRKGQGPGEIESPLSVQVQAREVMVPQAARRVSFFSTDGEFLRALSAKEYWVLVAAMDSKKNIYATVGIMDSDNPQIKVAFSDFHPAFGRFYCDDEGRIFVGTFERSPEGHYIHDVFDPEGRFITRVSFKGALLRVVRGRMYCREEDEEGFQKVVRYRLVWRFD